MSCLARKARFRSVRLMFSKVGGMALKVKTPSRFKDRASQSNLNVTHHNLTSKAPQSTLYHPALPPTAPPRNAMALLALRFLLPKT
jgi:hypothetical protein